MSGLAEKYASHLISQCPAEVKEEMLKYEKERKKEEAAEAKEAGAKTTAPAKTDKKGTKESMADNKKGQTKAKDKKNASRGQSDDESEKAQYVEVNKSMNSELIKCKQKLDKALSSMWDYVHVSNKLNKG